MIIKMSGAAALYVILTFFLWKWMEGKKLTVSRKILFGLIYGGMAVLSTHFGVDYKHMMMNVRDMGPLAAGLFFDPVSGIIAGLIGGIERYIAGTYWGVGSYTRIACSVSTCLAGFVAAGVSVFILKRKKPSILYSFFLGAVMEVFHMYVVFITHRSDMDMAFYVVKNCAGPMIIFTGIGMAVCSLVILKSTGKKLYFHLKGEEITVSQKFQFWLFGVMTLILLGSFLGSYAIQTQRAVQYARATIDTVAEDLTSIYEKNILGESFSYFHAGTEGTLDLIGSSGLIKLGNHGERSLSLQDLQSVNKAEKGKCFQSVMFGKESLCRVDDLNAGLRLLTTIPMSEVYEDREEQAYETGLASILLLTVVYMLVSQLVQQIVVNNLDLVNRSLSRIASGDLSEEVKVRSSSEFASLSDDINYTVEVLKGYISAAEKRMEEELELARKIQDSALPKKFYASIGHFDLYASMDPANEVGGDFYDFFFVNDKELALVIADVSGKGIPAALFMMQSKTAIRSLAEEGRSPSKILSAANNRLCEGNDAQMFVTAWIGILNLTTGHMRCANAGHEYPVIMHVPDLTEGASGDYELVKDKHGLALAAMEDMPYKEYELTLQHGDRLFVYTDGVPEAINENTEQYGTERLVKKLNELKEHSMQDTLTEVRQDIQSFVGDAEQFDDITMLGLTFLK